MDWNNDGQADLVTGEQDGHIRVYLGSAGGLGAFSYVEVGGADFVADGGFSKPDVVDWNKDGKKDLVVGDGLGFVHLLRNTGSDANPAFSADQSVKVGADSLSVADNGARSSPVVADFNGDGKKDLLVGAGDGQVYFFENSGTDAAPAFAAAGVAVQAGGSVLNVGYYARPEVSDWDADGALDLICGNGNGQVYYYHAQSPPPTVSIGDASIAEGNSGTTVLSFPATLSAPASAAVSVRYSTADWTATLADNDYAEAKGTLVFAAGQTTGKIDVVVNGDTKVEADEKFYLNLYHPTGLVIGRGQAVGTILNDDSVAPTPRMQAIVSWPKKAKAVIQNQQTKAIDFGAVAVRAAGPMRVISLTNTGTANLVLWKLRLAKGFKLVDRFPSTVSPGKTGKFTLQMGTTKRGTCRGNISFYTNIGSSSLFWFPVAGQVVAADKAVAASPRAFVQPAAGSLGVFCTRLVKPEGIVQELFETPPLVQASDGKSIAEP